jgi:hypothetical protein
MPATFASFGLEFLYPENWVVVPRDPEDGQEGVTLELPGGGFFAVERIRDDRGDEELIARLADSIAEEYQQSEREAVTLEGADANETAMDVRFYFLDLLVVSRLILLTVEEGRFVIQAQAESRDFDRNQPVFAAILKQIRDASRPSER